MSQVPAVYKVFVANIPFTKSEQNLEEFLRSAAKAKGVTLTVQECKIVRNKEDGRSKGFGFVTLPNEMAMQLCIGLSGSQFDGRSLSINIANEKPRRPSDRDPQTTDSFMSRNNTLS